MAILGQIRKKTGLLIGFTIVALLLFLLGGVDFTTLFSKDPNVLGKVNGEKITRREYFEQLEFLQEQYQGQQVPTLHDQTWKGIIEGKLIEEKFNNAGFLLTPKAVWSEGATSPMIANDPTFQVNGKFSIQKFQEFYDQLEQNRMSNETTARQYQFLQYLKRGFTTQALYKQYFGAYGAGMLTNKKEVDFIMANEKNTASIDYVKIDYNTYKGDSVKVTDEDIKEYINKHKILFKVEDNRTLDYSYFSSKPTEKDKQDILNEIKKYLVNGSILDGDTITSFKNSHEPYVYAESYSDRPIDSTYRYASDLPFSIREWVKNASKGDVSEPYEDQNFYYLSRFEGKKNVDSVRLKQIVISYEGTRVPAKMRRTKDTAKKVADSIASIVKTNPVEFAATALRISDDPQSASQGGDLGWITTIQPLASDFAQLSKIIENSPKGTVDVIDSPFGYIVIALEDRKVASQAYKLADLAKQIKASDKTESTAKSQSSKFMSDIQGKTAQEFVKIAKENNFLNDEQKGVLRFGTILRGITDFTKNEEIMAWAFDKKTTEGTIANFPLNDGYVVVRISKIFSKGLADPSIVREYIEPIIKNEKLAKIISEKINKKNKSLDEIATEYKIIKLTTTLTFNNAIIDGALEPKVGGAAFGLKEGQKSKAIEGAKGVFVISTKTINKVTDGDKKELRSLLLSQYSKGLPVLLMSSIQQDADIEDYRNEMMNQKK